MRRLIGSVVSLIVIMALIGGCGAPGSEPAQETPTARPTATRSPSPTPEPTRTPAPAATFKPKPPEPTRGTQSEPTRALQPTPIAGGAENSWPKVDVLRSSAWSNGDQSYFENGQLHLESNTKGQYWAVWSKLRDFGDFIYEAQVTKTGGPDNYGYGVIFQIREAADEFLLFEISGDGKYSVEFKSRGNWATQIAWRDAPSLAKGNSANKLRVAVLGDKAQFFINGQMVAWLNLTPGRGFVGAYSGEKGLHFFLSQMDVYSPD